MNSSCSNSWWTRLPGILVLCLQLNGPVLGADGETEEVVVDQSKVSSFARKLDRELPKSLWRLAPLSRLTKAAEGGDAEARLFLALRHEHGDGVPRSSERARMLILAAAESGSTLGEYFAGLRYADEDEAPGKLRGSGNYQVAAEWFERAAAKGHAGAAFELGCLYHVGQLARDDAQAIRWLTKAAEAGHARAAEYLAEAHAYDGETATGEPVPAQPREAVRWFGIAFDRGIENAAVTLADYLTLTGNFTDDPPLEWRRAEAKRWLRKAVRADNQGARARLVLLFDDPGALASVDVDLLREFAEARWGDPANVLLGRMHERGLGGAPRDLRLAANYYGRMAGMETNLLREAAAGLARVYSQPEFKPPHGNVPFQLQDPEVLRSAEGRLAVAELLWNGKGPITRNRTAALEWFVRAAQAGSAPAMRRLGEFWEEGVNGEPDPAEAKRWYRRAELAEKVGTKPDSASPQLK